jgi:hypothetical protein
MKNRSLRLYFVCGVCANGSRSELSLILEKIELKAYLLKRNFDLQVKYN